MCCVRKVTLRENKSELKFALNGEEKKIFREVNIGAIISICYRLHMKTHYGFKSFCASEISTNVPIT